MSLSQADIEDSYFLNGIQPYYFYNSLYKEASEITMALGYFSRTAFCVGTEDLMTFIEKNDGVLRFVCNDKLFRDDADAIENGYNLRSIGAVTIDDLKYLFTEKFLDSDWKRFSFKCLSYLIALNRLDIRVVRTNKLVHFKTGYAKDKDNNIVAFTGSVNYTLSALLLNYEQLTTFCSWKKPLLQERISEIVNPVNDLWNEEYSDLPLIKGSDIAEYIREKYLVSDAEELREEYAILKKKVIKNGRKIKIVNSNENSGLFFHFPNEIQIRPHQKRALSNWEQNHFKSIFAMATGTGKTLTSLFAVNDFNFEHKVSGLLVIVPLNDLVDQWAKDISKYLNCDAFIFKSNSGENFRTSMKNYSISKMGALYSKNELKPVVVITTYDTYIRHKEEVSSVFDFDNTILIADEVHNFGAETARTLLPDEMKFRIGLSATPKREYDEIGTKKVFEFFCPSDKPFVFTIDDAIKNDMLCHYNYYPSIVRLSDAEMVEYDEWSERIKKARRYMNSSDNDEDLKKLNKLLKNRHRVIERAANKEVVFFDVFTDVLIREKKMDNTIIFCPEGKVENEDVLQKYQKKVNQIGRNNNIYFSLRGYVEGVSKGVLRDFTDGKIDIVFAKQRLNEGIDIPSVKRAFFISSSTSEREFIQRRGRILRKSQGKELAEIYDFIVLPPENSHDDSIKKSESKRVMDFAFSADNFGDLTKIMNMIL